jgi:phosphatidylcholine synthase
MLEAGLLLHPAWAAAPVLASAYGFSRADAKTDDHFFLGFPSYWNVVAMYLYLFEVPAAAGLTLVLLLAAAVFIPVRYIYPSRTRMLRPLTLLVLALWLLGFTWLCVQPDPNRLWLGLSLVGPAYYLVASAILNLPRADPAAKLP